MPDPAGLRARGGRGQRQRQSRAATHPPSEPPQRLRVAALLVAAAACAIGASWRSEHVDGRCSPQLARVVRGAVNASFHARMSALIISTELGTATLNGSSGAGAAPAVDPHVTYLQRAAFSADDGEIVDKLWALARAAGSPGARELPNQRQPLRSLELVRHDAGEDARREREYETRGASLLTAAVVLSRRNLDFKGGAAWYPPPRCHPLSPPPRCPSPTTERTRVCAGEIELRRRFEGNATCVESHAADYGDMATWHGWEFQRFAPLSSGACIFLVAQWWPPTDNGTDAATAHPHAETAELRRAALAFADGGPTTTGLALLHREAALDLTDDRSKPLPMPRAGLSPEAEAHFRMAINVDPLHPGAASTFAALGLSHFHRRGKSEDPQKARPPSFGGHPSCASHLPHLVGDAGGRVVSDRRAQENERRDQGRRLGNCEEVDRRGARDCPAMAAQ